MRCKTCDYPLWNLVWIGSASYAVTPTTFGQLPSLLQQQNQHRATLGLPPLPDLTTVTHGNPALQAPADQGW